MNLSSGGAFRHQRLSPERSLLTWSRMLRVDQAWGLFQASVAAHDNHAAYYGATIDEQTGHPDDKWGLAGQLALSIKNIPTGPGDTINIQGVYTDGATRYNIQDLAGAYGAHDDLWQHQQSAGPIRASGSALLLTTRCSPTATLGQQLVQTWGFRGGYTHNWNPYWNTSIYGAYAAVRYNDTAKTLICGTGGVGGTLRAAFGPLVITACNPDYNIAQIGFITRWTPVKNLTFSAEVTYQHLDQSISGFGSFRGRQSASRRPSTNSRTRTTAILCSAPSATGNPVRLIEVSQSPRQETAGGFALPE